MCLNLQLLYLGELIVKNNVTPVIIYLSFIVIIIMAFYATQKYIY